MQATSALQMLMNRQSLDHGAMTELMQRIMAGEVPPTQLAALLVAWRMKGESVTEIAAAAQVMRGLATPVPLPHLPNLIDTCGTGGDGAHTFNISTVSALVAAAAGAQVAKHGGRSVSSLCGSADVLEALGVRLDLSPAAVGECIAELGVGFMFAPNHHQAMKHAASVRRELGVRTLFNLLGPLTNPAGARRQVMGVFAPEWVGTLARVHQALGSEHVLVVHGMDGLDEISLSQKTLVAELRQGEVHEYTLTPSELGLHMADPAGLAAPSLAAAVDRVHEVLTAQPGAAFDIVCLNAGAAIYVSGLRPSLKDGVHAARETLRSGAAQAKLAALVARTQALAAQASC